MTNPLGPLSPAVDTITINGVQAPGQWVLQPGGKVYGWQQQKGYALSGATLNPTCDELIEAPFLVRLWDTAFPLGGTDGGLQYQKFCQFRAQFLKKAVFGIPGGLAAYA
ncbi:MAG TPA: hypothetical protein VKU41_18090, partial [Polyangiaceae bacterium]|nr:hypothetical protein [Polyangiaceae bacterium]